MIFFSTNVACKNLLFQSIKKDEKINVFTGATARAKRHIMAIQSSTPHSQPFIKKGLAWRLLFGDFLGLNFLKLIKNYFLINSLGFWYNHGLIWRQLLDHNSKLKELNFSPSLGFELGSPGLNFLKLRDRAIH